MVRIITLVFAALLLGGCMTTRITYCTAVDVCSTLETRKDFFEGYDVTWGAFSITTKSSVAPPNPFEDVMARAVEEQLERAGIIGAGGSQPDQ